MANDIPLFTNTQKYRDESRDHYTMSTLCHMYMYNRVKDEQFLILGVGMSSDALYHFKLVTVMQRVLPWEFDGREITNSRRTFPSTTYGINGRPTGWSEVLNNQMHIRLGRN